MSASVIRSTHNAYRLAAVCAASSSLCNEVERSDLYNCSRAPLSWPAILFYPNKLRPRLISGADHNHTHMRVITSFRPEVGWSHQRVPSMNNLWLHYYMHGAAPITQYMAASTWPTFRPFHVRIKLNTQRKGVSRSAVFLPLLSVSLGYWTSGSVKPTTWRVC